MPEERRLGGPFRVDLTVRIDAPARSRDRLSDTVDYRALYSRARNVMEKRRFRTLEALAETIATAVVGQPKVRSVRIRVTKLASPLGPGTACAVEIDRP
jgi:dihydroneopterin aldolase